MTDGWRAIPGMVAKATRAARPALYPLLTSGEPQQFPIDWRHLAQSPDDDGAVRTGAGATRYVHPVATCFSVIARSQSARLDGKEGRKEDLQKAVQTLLREQGDDGAFRYPVSVARYQLEPGWSSALAQGLFVAAVSEVGDLLTLSLRRSAEDAVMAAVDHLLLPVGQGGCTLVDDAGVFFEECPTARASYILNGAALAILGLSSSSESIHQDVAREAARSLAGRMHAWDLGYWSRYDLLDRAPSSPDYHSLHCSLVQALEMRFPCNGFDAWATRFILQSCQPVNRGRALGTLALRRLGDVAKGRR